MALATGSGAVLEGLAASGGTDDGEETSGSGKGRAEAVSAAVNFFFKSLRGEDCSWGETPGPPSHDGGDEPLIDGGGWPPDSIAESLPINSPRSRMFSSRATRTRASSTIRRP